LRVLEKAGLLRRRRYGRRHEMQLEANPLKQAAQWVEEYRKFWEGSLDRLALYLEKTNKAVAQKGNKRPCAPHASPISFWSQSARLRVAGSPHWRSRNCL